MNREWRWHKLLRQWLQKDGQQATSSNASNALALRDLTNGHPIGAPPVRLGDRGEKGVYVFFDVMNWRRERRWLELDYEHLDSGRVGTAINSIVNSQQPAGGMPRRMDGGGQGQGQGQGLEGIGMSAGGQVGGGSSSVPAA